MVSRLYNGLSRLVSPFAEKTGFVIEIDSPEFPLIQGKVVNRLLETSPYQLSGHIDSEGRFFADNQQEQPIDLYARTAMIILYSHQEKTVLLFVGLSASRCISGI